MSVSLRSVTSLVAHHAGVRRAIVSAPGIRNIAWRFVAGEDLDAGAATVRALNRDGIKATLHHVGTHVRAADEAVAAADVYLDGLRRIRRDRLDANVSVKLTQIGLDVDEALCRAQLRRILDAATEVDGFVRIDMEESRYVDRTLDIHEAMATAYGNDRVGVVLQSYLRGREGDIERAVARRWRVRLVKGGYWEAPGVVHRRKADIDAAFRRDAETLLARGAHLALATHDEAAIEHALRVAAARDVDPRGFELQMLYGVRPDLQRRLVAGGHVVRCYVPFGTRWYEYVLGCVRRIPGGVLDRVRVRLRPARP